MAYADLKNDFVFRKVFGHHPDVLVGLLNDLLDRQGSHVIVALEYLPPDQAPEVPGFKLSIVDVKCREAGGDTFEVEMQVVHLKGFLNRVVYNAAKAYIQPLQTGGKYTALTPVIGVSICDFALWPDEVQDAHGLPRIPMVSRWRFTERASGAEGIPQVQLAFLELAKLGTKVPRDAVERWAAIFAHAHEVEPESLKDVPFTPAQRHALELANKATFTEAELDAYQRVRDEIDQALQLAEEAHEKGITKGIAKGMEEGLREGEKRGQEKGIAALRTSLRAVLAARGLITTDEHLARIERCESTETLGRWMVRAATVTDVEAIFAD